MNWKKLRWKIRELVADTIPIVLGFLIYHLFGFELAVVVLLGILVRNGWELNLMVKA